MVLFNACLAQQMAPCCPWFASLLPPPSYLSVSQTKTLLWPGKPSPARPAAGLSHWTAGKRRNLVVTTCDVTTGLRRGEDCGSNYAVSGRGRAGTPLCDVWAAPCRGDRVQHAPSQAKLHGRLAR